jgi:hypothetical protein
VLHRFTGVGEGIWGRSEKTRQKLGEKYYTQVPLDPSMYMMRLARNTVYVMRL